MLEFFLVVPILWGLFRNKLPIVFLFIVILYKTNWFFGTSTSELFFYHNLYDVGLFFIIVLTIKLLKRKGNNGIDVKVIKKGFFFFVMFFLLCSFVDLLVNHTPLVSQIKAAKNYVPLILLSVVNKITKDEAIRFFKLLILTTTIFSALFVFEQLSGLSITGAAHTAGGSRCPLPWPLALLCFALLISGKYVVSKKIRLLFFIALLANVVLCGSRSFFLSYVFVFSLFILLSKPSLKKAFAVILGIVAILLIFSTDNILSRRFNDSKSDMQSLQANTGEVEGNFSFRVLLMNERLEYVANSWQYSIFGIGNIEEKNFKKEIFFIGHMDESGKVYQVDTGDIAWAIAFLRWGILGTLIYVLLPYRRFIIYTFRNRKSPYAQAIFLYLCANLFLISWTYSDIVTMDFWVVPIVLLPISCLVLENRKQKSYA